ncbi:uncharacterized protein LOC123318219 [Coccinella septempunctata]|uniref:uncharacterized protein LOC123318219 n=1 Tax=Coccinella septempunctata TaxID=41139 RepID=UPI001D085E55|nr:uncharacterized protein LOC123318219 [Coccinella septempunctata]
MPLSIEERIARADALREIAINQLVLIETCAFNAQQDESHITKFAMAFKNLKKLQKDFEKQHLAIAVALAGDSAKLQAQSEIMNDFCARCLEIETTYHTLIADKQIDQRSRTNTTAFQNTSIANNNDCIRLPRIELKEFSGSIQEFPSFIELFDTLVHGNDRLSEIEKFTYLISKVHGPPHALIRNLPIVSANYTVAYNALRDRYDNKRLRAVNSWKQLEGCPKLQKGDFKSLRYLLDTFSENLEVLRTMRYDVDSWCFILSNMLLDRLDPNTRREFEKGHASNEIPKYVDVRNYILAQCKALETFSLCTKAPGETPKNQSDTSRTTQRNALLSKTKRDVDKPIKSTRCSLCEGEHSIHNCAEFLNINASERFQVTKQKRLCVNCLSNKHTSSNCPSKYRCRQCKGTHHTLLHFTENLERSNTNAEQEPTHQTVAMFTKGEHEVLLSTALVSVRDAFGNIQTARAVLDSGSQSCFVTKGFANKLGLKKINIAATLHGLDRMHMPAKSGIHCVISGEDSTEFQADFIILDQICDSLPVTGFNKDKIPYLRGLKLADPNFNRRDKVDMLLGAEIYPLVLKEGRIVLDADSPVCLNTSFGWVVTGKLASLQKTQCTTPRPVKTFFAKYTTNDQLNDTLRLFWKTEEVPEAKIENPEDAFCENHFIQNIKHDERGGFTVSLPFKINAPDFGDTRSLAMRRSLSLERRLMQNAQSRIAYTDVINEYLNKGHMTEVEPPTVTELNSTFYIPHHAVLKADSTSTPLRVVMDASSHVPGKMSLNQALYSGPKLQRDLVEILINFRLHKYVMLTDIRQMFRMIQVEPRQRQYQRILWRPHQDSPITDYQLNVLVFGITSSPFLAIRTLLYLADKYEDFPLASQILRTQTFVDDITFGSDDLDMIENMRDQLIGLLSKGKFELRKWASNTRSLLDGLPEEHIQNIDFSFDSESNVSLKILGLKWSPVKDQFFFTFKNFDSKCTKRTMLSELARTFDPMGILTPITFYTKILIQRLWTLGLGWDETPPKDLVDKWSHFKRDLTVLSSFALPRHIDFRDTYSCHLIGFCDASIEGTCAVTYLRIKYRSSAVKTHFLLAKSKVAPLQSVSLPRLELDAAVLLAKLLKYVTEVLKDKICLTDIYAFSDSSVALSWIKNSLHLWKTYVANRVAFIQESVPPNKWHHVSSKDNAADCGSRGIFPSELLSHTLWWTGPQFLLDEPTSWVKKIQIRDKDSIESERRKITLSVQVKQPNILDTLLDKYSSLHRIKRVLAYIIRFKNRCLKRQHATIGEVDCLTHGELQSALVSIIRHEQRKYFGDEILMIKNEERLPKSLRVLNPFMKDDVIRVGGRLRNADMPYDNKFPILIPSKSVLAKLLITEIHVQYMHAGIETTLSLLKRNYWILGAKRITRRIVGNCIPCWKVRPTSFLRPMGNLPDFRVKQARPFLNTGVDLAGPFMIKMGRIRTNKTFKAWICLFVCCATKAIHMELISELSSDAFLAGFRRFIGRRGICKNIYSDCGKNFIGSDKYLKNIYALVAEKEAIRWHFNPPSAPHMGGLWEANIKVVKTHLKRVTGSQILTYEEMNTVLVQIEAVLNSRPLTPLSSDPNDLSVLTPAHFLISEPLTTIPDPDTSDVPINRLTRWQLLVRMRTDFWKRWKTEYLHTLTQRSKWHFPDKSTPRIGDLVLIKSDNEPPLEWALGRITELNYGTDGIARVASVRTAKGILRRPLVKLCPLPTY